MNVSGFLAEVGDVLDDPNAEMYSAEQIVRHGDRQLRGLYRTQVESNKQYSNFTMAVQKEAALEPVDNVFDYRLPLWIMAVVRVWVRNGSATSEPSFSVYQWTSGAAQLGAEIPKTTDEMTPRWGWQGTQTIRLQRFSEPQELIMEVVARPAQMAKVKIDTANASAAKMYLPSTPNYGTLELEVGAYINSDWQVTETADTNATHFGEVRRCIYSDAANLLTGARTYELSMDSAFTNVLAQGDVVETVLALPDEHTRLLVLRTARACLQQKGNLKGIASLQNELVDEEMKFREYATPPRDARGPSDWKRKSPFELRRSTAYPYYRYPYGI